jgi:hypothetical protein
MAYKIMRKENGILKTLFHGVSGSRSIPLQTWINAEQKNGIDGANQTPYLTGFHIFKTKKEAEAYLIFFRKQEGLTIINCKARGIRRKERSRRNVFLADKIYIDV